MRSLFRAVYGIEKKRLIGSITWPGILEVKADGIVFHVLSGRLLNIRGAFVEVGSLLAVTISSLPLWRPLFAFEFQFVPADIWPVWLLVIGIVDILQGLVIWFLGVFGCMYLFDFLTLHLQAHFSKEAGVLKLEEVRMGRFRHVIRASVEKELIPMKSENGEVVMTVAATRRGFSKALRRANALSTTSMGQSGAHSNPTIA